MNVRECDDYISDMIVDDQARRTLLAARSDASVCRSMSVRCDTMCCFDACSDADISRLNLPHGRKSYVSEKHKNKNRCKNRLFGSCTNMLDYYNYKLCIKCINYPY